MSAQLNLNTHQAYGFAYDKIVVGWLVPQNPAPPDFVREFYNEYQKKLARCIWSVFGTDADGQPNNGAALLPRQTLRNAPNIDMSRTEGQLSRVGRTTDAGLTQGPNGTIEIARGIRDFTLPSGTVLGAREIQMRTYAHELGNLLAGRIVGTVAGGSEVYGSRTPITSVTGIPDQDAGARLESCIFGNTSP